jgi:predicted nucleotidyltransferase
MTDINSYLFKLSNQLTYSKLERDRIDVSYNYLEGKLFENFRDRIHEVRLFGSYTRGTSLPQSIDTNSDVDVMVIFKTNQYQPDTFLKHLQEFADKIYPRSEVSPDHPAVTVVLEHTKFELVPAYWESFFWGSNKLQIPAPRNKDLKWITTDPDEIENSLIRKNSEENGQIIPLVKLLKYLNILNGRPFESFKIDVQAVTHNYPENEIINYFLEFISDMDTAYKTDEQVKFIQMLKERRKNILHLLEGNLEKYAIMELQSFLPLVED